MFTVRLLIGSSPIGKGRCPNFLQHSVNIFSSSDIDSKLNLPQRPKKPMSPFMMFMKEQRPHLIQENPNISSVDVAKIAGQKWRTLDSAAKEHLQKQYLEKIKDFAVSVEEYKKQLTDEQKEEIRRTSLEQKEEKRQKRISREKREFGKPKKPVTAFGSFMKEQSAARNIKPTKDIVKSLSQEWLAMSEEEKAVYKAAYPEAYQAYKMNLVKWESEMIEKGKKELVRKSTLMNSNAQSTQESRKISKKGKSEAHKE